MSCMTALVLTVLWMAFDPIVAGATELATGDSIGSSREAQVSASPAVPGIRSDQSLEQAVPARQLSGTSDCDDKTATTAKASLRVNRFVRASSVVQGVQCTDISGDATEFSANERH